MDEGDHLLGRVGQLARPLREGAGALVAAEVEQVGAGPGVLADVGVDLVPVAEGIHQPVVARVAGQERTTVDQRPGLVAWNPQPLGDRVGELLRERDHQPLHCLAGGRGEAALGEPVVCALVLLPLRDLVVQAELVHRVTEEQLLEAEPGQVELAGWLEVDLVERGGQVIGHVPRREFAERLCPGHGGLARAGEVLHRGPQFLDPCQPDRTAAELDHQRPHPVIAAGPAQPVQHVGQARPAHGEQGGDRVARRLLHQPVGEVEFQDQRGGPSLAHPCDLLLQHQLGHESHHTGTPAHGREQDYRPASGHPGRAGRCLSYRRLK